MEYNSLNKLKIHFIYIGEHMASELHLCKLVKLPVNISKTNLCTL